MLRLSEERRQPVRDSAGEVLGRVVDLVIHLADDPASDESTQTPDPDAGHPRVLAVVVEPPDGHRFRLPWRQVDAFDHTEVRCRPERALIDTSYSGASLVGPGELLLVRDVLDTQVVDLGDSRLTRVGDVLLTRTDDGTLRVAAVEVGFSAVVRRLGLRTLADRLGEDVIDWADLHLTSARGHQVQLTSSAATVHQLTPGELTRLLHRLSTDEGTDVLASLTPAQAAEAMTVARADLGARLVSALTEAEAAPVLAAMTEDRARRFRALRRRGVPRRRYLRHRVRRSRTTPPTPPARDASPPKPGEPAP